MGIETQDQLPQRRCVMRPASGLLAVALVAVMSAQDAHAFTYTNGSRSPCRGAVEHYLINRGITEAEVRTIAIHPFFSRPLFARRHNDVELVGYDADVRFVGEQSTLVIRMRRHCGIKRTYRRGRW